MQRQLSDHKGKFSESLEGSQEALEHILGSDVMLKEQDVSTTVTVCVCVCVCVRVLSITWYTIHHSPSPHTTHRTPRTTHHSPLPTHHSPHTTHHNHRVG